MHRLHSATKDEFMLDITFRLHRLFGILRVKRHELYLSQSFFQFTNSRMRRMNITQTLAYRQP